MAIEPVNERPIFPSLVRADEIGVATWSVSMIRQLTTVFQQYGYKLNHALLDEDLAANGGTIPETDRTNTWPSAQVFQTAPTATGHPLRFDELAVNGGNIPTTDNNTASNGFYVDDAVNNPLRAGREDGQHVRLTGDIGGNYIRSVTRTTNAKHLRLHSTTNDTNDTPSAGSVGIFFDILGTSRGRMHQDGGFEWGSPTGGSQGAGTINAQAVYDDGSLLTDYVFDGEIDGEIDVEAYDRKVPDREFRDEDGNVLRVETRVHTPCRAFNQRKDDLDPRNFESKWRSSRKLPAIERLPEKASVGELTQALLETCEVQAVHIAKLEARIKALEDANG